MTIVSRLKGFFMMLEGDPWLNDGNYEVNLRQMTDIRNSSNPGDHSCRSHVRQRISIEKHSALSIAMAWCTLKSLVDSLLIMVMNLHGY